MKIKQHSWKRHVAVLILGMGILLASAAMQVQASENETDIWISDNRNTQDYTGDNWADRMYNYLTSTENGYMRIQLKKDGTLYADYFDRAFVFRSQKIIPGELTMPGGFYEGKDSYYLAYGQGNSEQSDSKEVLRIVQYDKNWNRIAKTSVYGANTVSPFEAGSLRMIEKNGKLYVRTCHKMYASSDGKNHQSNMTFVINESDMSVVDESYKVSNISTAMAYVSHSFNQFVLADDADDIVFMDHGDAYPRSIVISKMGKGSARKNILTFSGKIGDNFTGATIGGLEFSASNYLVAGTYGATQSSDENQVFLAVNDRKLQGETQMIILASKENGKVYATPQLVKCSDDKFLILWAEDNGDLNFYSRMSDGNIHYVFVDGNGKKLGNEQVQKGYLSDCKPIVDNGQILWTVADNKHLTFYQMNEDGSLQSKNADFPKDIMIYPYDLAKCRLVAKKIGPMKYPNSDNSIMSAFILCRDNVKNPLKLNQDFEINGCGKTKLSSAGNAWYVNSLYLDSFGEKYYGSKTFSASGEEFDLPEFIHEKPQKVSAKKNTDGIYVKWQKEPYALGYYVYRQKGKGGFKKIASISNASQNSYMDKSAKGKGVYRYYIKTYTTNGTSIITSKKSDIITIK